MKNKMLRLLLISQMVILLSGTLLSQTGCKTVESAFSITIDGPAYPPLLHDNGVRPKTVESNKIEKQIHAAVENVSGNFISNIQLAQHTSTARINSLTNKANAFGNILESNVLSIVKNSRNTNTLKSELSQYVSTQVKNLNGELSIASLDHANSEEINVMVTNLVTNLTQKIGDILSTNYVLSRVNETNVTTHLQIAADDDAMQEFGNTFAKCFYVGEIVIENDNTNNPLLAYSSSLTAQINYFITESEWGKDTNIQKKIDWINDINYPDGTNGYCYVVNCPRRPSTYSDILAIFEYQRKADRRQQIFDWIKTAGEIAAGASVFVSGPAYPKAVAFATGIIEPELEKRLLWDVILHAKNLETRSLKEIEEVPASGSIHRVVFFPKRGIPGVVANHLVYISSFNPKTTVTISGSLIQKVSSVQSGSK